MLGFLIRDLWVRLMLAVWLAVAAFYLLPAVSVEARTYFGDYLLSLTFLPLTIGAIGANSNRVATKLERRFWQALAAAFLVWFGYAVVAVFIPDDRWSLTWSVIGDCAYLGFYLLILLGIELKPHLETIDSVEARQRRLRSSAIAVLLFGWLCYLIVIPAAVDAEAYRTEIPSFLLYLSLDAVIVARLVWIMRETASLRWTTLYRLLILAMGWMFTADLLEALYVADLANTGSGTPLDLWWTVPLVLTGAAARARHMPFEVRQGDDLKQDRASRPSARVDLLMLGGAVALPSLHHALYAAGALSPESQGYRLALVQATVISLAALAIVAFKLNERERQRMEAREDVLRRELDQARRIDAVARVAGALAHDFNNLLQVIRVRAEIAARNLLSSHAAHEELDEIRSAATRAAAMASDLLTFGRRQPVAVETISVHTFVGNVRRQLELTAGEEVHLTIQLRAEQDVVSIDTLKFERVLLNLVANARNAMPAGGRIQIETWNPPVTAGRERRVALAVRDTGEGMTPEVLEKAFEPFFTTRRDQGGSGLGLSSAYGIVQAMGGSIRAESQPGIGTSMVIELPAVLAPAEAALPYQPHGALLIVETEPHMRQMLRGVFSDVWRPVLTAANATEALQIAVTSGHTISMLITDTTPSGLTYEALINRLRVLWPEVQVVLIAPEDFAGEPEGCVVMREPLSLAALAYQARTMLFKHRAPAPPPPAP